MDATSYNKPLRTISKGIIQWNRFYKQHSSQVKEVLKCFTATTLFTKFQQHQSVNYYQGQFSVSDFFTNSQKKISKETLDLLSVSPRRRNEADIKQIEIGLRSYSEIAMLPAHFIECFARKAWHQRFEPFSVILREGDLPLYYYFILSGRVLVSVIDREKMIAHVVVYLKRGDSFGELSLLYNTRRTSTVIVVEEVSLMILEKADYKRLFMSGERSDQEIEFLKRVPCFHKFPFSRLSSTKKENVIKLNYFSPGSVLIEDSKMTNWIFIIKSGRVKVMMPIEENDYQIVQSNSVNAKEISNKGKLPLITNKTKVDYPKRITTTEHRHFLKLQIRQHLKKAIEEQDKYRQPLVKNYFEFGLPMNMKDPKEILNEIGREDTIIDLKSKERIEKIFNYHYNPAFARNHVLSSEETPVINIIAHKLSNENILSGKRTLSTDLNKEYHKMIQSLPFFKRNQILQKKYINIQVLTAGTFFGLEEKFYFNQPHLKIISDGCECFAMSKEFYFENVSEETLNFVENRLRPYPSQKEILAQSEQWKNWKINKTRIYEETIKLVNKKKYTPSSNRFVTN